MLTENIGLEQAKEQLRHKNLETTMRYTKANTQGRKEITADLLKPSTVDTNGVLNTEKDGTVERVVDE